jgi:hypothetical protein
MSGEDYLYYFVVDGSKRYDFEQENVRSILIEGDQILVNSITIPRGGRYAFEIIGLLETIRRGVVAEDESVCWSDSSSSSWSNNELEMQFMSPMMMPKKFNPKQVKPCIKQQTTTTTITTTNNRTSYCGNNNRRKVVHFEAD